METQPTNRYVQHLETVSSHDEAVAYLTQLNRTALVKTAKVLDLPTNVNCDRLIQVIVANTVDYD